MKICWKPTPRAHDLVSSNLYQSNDIDRHRQYAVLKLSALGRVQPVIATAFAG